MAGHRSSNQWYAEIAVPMPASVIAYGAMALSRRTAATVSTTASEYIAMR